MTSQVTVGPRVEFRLGRYVRLRAWDADRGADRFVYVHRLTLYAHGELDSPWADDADGPHGHHRDGDGWNNDPANLEPRDPEGHGRHHRREQVKS